MASTPAYTSVNRVSKRALIVSVNTNDPATKATPRMIEIAVRVILRRLAVRPLMAVRSIGQPPSTFMRSMTVSGVGASI